MRILVFRLGSIGDFVVSLPCFHLLRRTYPHSEIVLLTNEPSSARAAPAETVLEGTGLVDRYLKYAPGMRNSRDLFKLKSDIQAIAADTLVYLAPPRGPVSIYRDHLFFRWCGVGRIVGLPLAPKLLEARAPQSGDSLWEPEAQRLGRQIASLGEIDIGRAENWDLHLSACEVAEAQRLLNEGLPSDRARSAGTIGLSVGTKQPINDWGDENWSAVLSGLEVFGHCLVLIGGPEDLARSEGLAAAWRHPVLNLCGRLSPRLSAAVIRQIDLFLCHDSGPMHLAASVGARCVAVFSKRNPPGQWFPFGAGHKILYPSANAGTIKSILPRQVLAAAVSALEPRRSTPLAA